jgi:hypothetical protein
MLFLELRISTPNGSDCRKCSVIRSICAASFFDVVIDKIYEAGIEEILKLIVRILTKNVISYYAYRCITCNNGSVEGERRRGLARECCVNSFG